MWSAICKGIGYVLEFFYSLIPNYAVALLLFALAFKIILLPFSIKQQKNSVRQAKLRPKEMAIRKKYKGRNDQTSRQRMQQEIMELQQREGFSPFGGCLPLLLQMPIIFALYSVVRNPLQYIVHMSEGLINAINGAMVRLEFFAEKDLANNQIGVTQKLKDHFVAVKENIIANTNAAENGALLDELKALEVGNLPNFNAFGNAFNLAEVPSWTSWLVLIPIFTFVVMFASMKITRKLSMPAVPGGDEQTADAMKSMQLMDFVMPLMSVWIAFIMPAVIGLYWIYQTLFGIGQQFLLRVMYPFPKFTEEDYKEAEREILGKNPKKKKKKTNGETVADPNRPRPRSLHYIDADEDEEAPAPSVTEQAEKSEAETGEKLIAAAPLKEDAIARPEKKKKSAKAEKEPIVEETTSPTETETKTEDTDETSGNEE